MYLREIAAGPEYSASPAYEFLLSCSMTVPTPAQVTMVDAMTAAIRTSSDTDANPKLVSLIKTSDDLGYPTHDLLAAAEYAVLDAVVLSDAAPVSVLRTSHDVNAMIRAATRTSLPAAA